MISDLTVQFIARFHRPRLVLTHNFTFLPFDLFKKVELELDGRKVKVSRNESSIRLLIHFFFIHDHFAALAAPSCS